MVLKGRKSSLRWAKAARATNDDAAVIFCHISFITGKEKECAGRKADPDVTAHLISSKSCIIAP